MIKTKSLSTPNDDIMLEYTKEEIKEKFEERERNMKYELEQEKGMRELAEKRVEAVETTNETLREQVNIGKGKMEELKSNYDGLKVKYDELKRKYRDLKEENKTRKQQDQGGDETSEKETKEEMRQKAMNDFNEYKLFRKRYGGPQSPKSWIKWKNQGGKDTEEFVKSYNEKQKAKRDRRIRGKEKRDNNMVTPYVTNKLDQRNFYISLNGEHSIGVRL